MGSLTQPWAYITSRPPAGVAFSGRGVYGFPPEQAARIAVRTIGSTPTAVGQVRLVAFDQTTRDLLQAALSL